MGLVGLRGAWMGVVLGSMRHRPNSTHVCHHGAEAPPNRQRPGEQAENAPETSQKTPESPPPSITASVSGLEGHAAEGLIAEPPQPTCRVCEGVPNLNRLEQNATYNPHLLAAINKIRTMATPCGPSTKVSFPESQNS